MCKHKNHLFHGSYDIFNNFAPESEFHGWNVLACGVTSTLKMFWNLEHFGFLVFGLGCGGFLSRASVSWRGSDLVDCSPGNA